jgi:integrase
MNAAHLKIVKRSDMRPVAGRKANKAYRTREHLTEAEMTKLLAALKANRHGHRDWLIGLIIYRHGLRVSEACDLRWDDLDLPKRTITVRRLKGSTDSTHYLERDELAGPKTIAKAAGVQSLCIRQRAWAAIRSYGHRPHDRASRRASQDRLSGACSYAQAFHRLCAGR